MSRIKDYIRKKILTSNFMSQVKENISRALYLLLGGLIGIGAMGIHDGEKYRGITAGNNKTIVDGNKTDGDIYLNNFDSQRKAYLNNELIPRDDELAEYNHDRTNKNFLKNNLEDLFTTKIENYIEDYRLYSDYDSTITDEELRKKAILKILKSYYAYTYNQHHMDQEISLNDVLFITKEPTSNGSNPNQMGDLYLARSTAKNGDNILIRTRNKTEYSNYNHIGESIIYVEVNTPSEHKTEAIALDYSDETDFNGDSIGIYKTVAGYDDFGYPIGLPENGQNGDIIPETGETTLLEIAKSMNYGLNWALTQEDKSAARANMNAFIGSIVEDLPKNFKVSDLDTILQQGLSEEYLSFLKEDAKEDEELSNY